MTIVQHWQLVPCLLSILKSKNDPLYRKSHVQSYPHWHWELRVVMVTTCGATKVGTVTALDFEWTSTIQSAIDAHATPIQRLLDHWLIDIVIYRISLALCALDTQHAGIWAYTTVKYDLNFTYPLITVMCMQADFSGNIDSTCSG